MRLRHTLWLCLLSALWACAPAAPTPTPSPPLRFAYDLWPGYYPVIIAEQYGFFAQQGVQVQATRPENTDRLLSDFAAEKYDGVAVALGDLINVTATNPDVRVIFASDVSDGGDALLVTGSLSQVTDLKGKRIGTNLGGFGELFIRTVLAREGVSPRDVIWVNVDAAEVPQLLLAGELDAGHTWEPYVSQATAAGARVLFSSHDTPGLIPDVVAFRANVIAQNPQAVQAFVRGWFQAVEYWNLNGAEGNALVAKHLNIPADSISLQGIDLMTLEENRALFDQSNAAGSIYATTKQYTDFFLQSGSLNAAPEPQQLLDPSFLK